MSAKLTDAERTTIVNALTLSAVQHAKDAEVASELALHGQTTRPSAVALADQFRKQAEDARQLRDKLEFLWSHIQF
jgi:hypothetical protein